MMTEAETKELIFKVANYQREKSELQDKVGTIRFFDWKIPFDSLTLDDIIMLRYK